MARAFVLSAPVAETSTAQCALHMQSSGCRGSSGATRTRASAAMWLLSCGRRRPVHEPVSKTHSLPRKPTLPCVLAISALCAARDTLSWVCACVQVASRDTSAHNVRHLLVSLRRAYAVHWRCVAVTAFVSCKLQSMRVDAVVTRLAGLCCRLVIVSHSLPNVQRAPTDSGDRVACHQRACIHCFVGGQHACTRCVACSPAAHSAGTAWRQGKRTWHTLSHSRGALAHIHAVCKVWQRLCLDGVPAVCSSR